MNLDAALSQREQHLESFIKAFNAAMVAENVGFLSHFTQCTCTKCWCLFSGFPRRKLLKSRGGRFS
jgi:hypothetical protein